MQFTKSATWYKGDMPSVYYAGRRRFITRMHFGPLESCAIVPYPAHSSVDDYHNYSRSTNTANRAHPLARGLS